VPLIAAGPDLPRGRTLGTPASLVDLFPTILDGAGVPVRDDLPGRSLWPLLTGPEEPDREIFCEYHAHGTPGATYLLRGGPLKYVYYVGYRPQLFDLATDPGERHDLAPDPRHAGTLALFEARLRAIVDPEGADRRAKADQARRLDSLRTRGAALPEGSPWPG